MDKGKDIGIGIKAPKKDCDDPNCPFHGSLKVRGKLFQAKVVKSRMQKTATVEWTRFRQVPKYERSEKSRSRVKAHNPPCIKAAEGDSVTIVETRPLSKTKSFVIVSKNEGN
jgi:small subunit ribosomal protein S17